MCPGCQVVRFLHSAQTGMAISTTIRTMKLGVESSEGSSRRSTQRIWTPKMPPAYLNAASRNSGFSIPARIHCPTIATRMMRYPTTIVRKSLFSMVTGTPAASTSTPAICTSVSRRYRASSTSNADANQVKLTQAHQTAANTIANDPIPAA